MKMKALQEHIEVLKKAKKEKKNKKKKKKKHRGQINFEIFTIFSIKNVSRENHKKSISLLISIYSTLLVCLSVCNH